MAGCRTWSLHLSAHVPLDTSNTSGHSCKHINRGLRHCQTAACDGCRSPGVEQSGKAWHPTHIRQWDPNWSQLPMPG